MLEMLEKSSFTLTHSVIKDIASELLERGLYQPVNISTKLHSNRFSRSSLLHETLPRQITMRTILWSSENGGKSQQSVFAFMVGEEDSHQALLDKVNELRPSLISLQKIYFPEEFYEQLYDQTGSVTGVSMQSFKLLTSMVIGHGI